MKVLDQFAARRNQYVQRESESESKNEQAKDEILKHIQEETLETISELSETEFERKNKNALLIDKAIRERKVEKKRHIKQVTG